MPIEHSSIQRINQLVNHLTSPRSNRQPSRQSQNTSTSGSSSFVQSFIYSNTSAQREDEIGSVVNASNELVELLSQSSNVGDLRSLVRDHGLEEWKLLRAGLLACVYGRNVSEEARTKFRNKFMYFTRHDDVPVNRITNPFLSSVTTEEVFWSVDHLYNIFSNASHFHMATQRPDRETPSMLEAFLKHVNGSAEIHSPTGQRYGTGTKAQMGTIDDFPGPGFMIRGLGKKAKLFPKGFIQKSFPFSTGIQLSPKQYVDNEYRKFLIQSENDALNTNIALFRGILIISNPKMLIDGKRYDLISYRDHFHNPGQEIAFFVPHGICKGFFNNPTAFINRATFFHPQELLKRFGKEIIVPTYESALGGFDKTFPFGPGTPSFYKGEPRYDMWGREHRWHLCHPEERLGTSETYDTKGYIHRTHDFAKLTYQWETHDGYWYDEYDSRNYDIDKKAHDDVRNCMFFAKSQYDLLKAAFRLYNFGYEYDVSRGIFIRDEFRLLKNALSFRAAERYPEGEKPFLTGVEQGRDSSFRTDYIRNIGLVDTNEMLWHRAASEKSKSNLETLVLPGNPLHPDLDSRNRLIWEDRTGVKEVKNYFDFQNEAFGRAAEPVFYYGQPSLRNSFLQAISKGEQ